MKFCANDSDKTSNYQLTSSRARIKIANRKMTTLRMASAKDVGLYVSDEIVF